MPTTKLRVTSPTRRALHFGGYLGDKKMEFINVKGQYEHLKSEIDAAVARVMARGRFIMGPEVARFERELAEYVGVKNVVSCGNGTDALQLLYMAYGVGAGDAVFAPDVTFIATHEPACMLGAEPVFCDIDPLTYNISPDDLELKIKAVLAEGRLRARCITAVDFLGNPCDWERLGEIADRYGLLLIEDAAQSVGGSYNGKKCCSFGDSAATSFFPTKPLGCFGDGGALFTDDDEIADIARSLRVHGKGTSKYDNVRIGVNSRLDTIQAAILSVKLRHLDGETVARQLVARRYDETLGAKFGAQLIAKNSVSAYAQYAVMTDSRERRDYIVNALEKAGIPSLVYYPTEQHRVPVFAGCAGARGDFPASHAYVSRALCLPFSPYLAEDDQRRVIETLLSC